MDDLSLPFGTGRVHFRPRINSYRSPTPRLARGVQLSQRGGRSERHDVLLCVCTVQCLVGANLVITNREHAHRHAAEATRGDLSRHSGLIRDKVRTLDDPSGERWRGSRGSLIDHFPRLERRIFCGFASWDPREWREIVQSEIWGHLIGYNRYL